MYVTGIGRTKFGVLNQSIPELAYEAMQKALGDCKLPIKEVDAIFVANFVGGEFQSQLHLNSVVSGLLPDLNIPIFRVETACAAGGSSLYLALMSLSRFHNVMVLGVEKMSGVGTLESASNIGMAGDRILDQAEGLIFPASYALSAQQHMRKYGTSLDDLGAVSYKNHQNANLNELAHFFGVDVSLKMIKESPVVCSPLRLFDCSPISDGAAAVIVSRKKRTDRDVAVTASALATDSISLSQRKAATTFPAAKIAAKQAYSQAKLSAKDIDVAEVHDCFTIAELIALEDLGFCKPGKSKDLIRSDATALSGSLPVNTDGGLKADGHPIGASGIAQVFEVVTQLRGEAKRRQVAGAEIGLTHNIGGIGGTAVVHILEGC